MLKFNLKTISNLSFNDKNIIDSFKHELKQAKGTFEQVSATDTTVQIKIEGRVHGELKVKDDGLILSGTEILKKIFIKSKKFVIIESDLNSFVFKGININDLDNYPMINTLTDLKKIHKNWSEIVKTTKDVTYTDEGNSYHTDLTLYMPTSSADKVIPYLVNKGMDELKGHAPDIALCDGEQKKSITIGKFTIGQYYPLRNIIALSFNPLKTKPIIFNEVYKTLLKLKVSKHSTKHMDYMLLAKELMKSKVENIKNIEKNLKKTNEDIEKTKHELTVLIGSRYTHETDLGCLRSNTSTAEKQLSTELKTIKSFKFVERVWIEDNSLKVKYVPTYITVNDFTRGVKHHGVRDIFLGSITFSFTNRGLTLSNTHCFDNRPHPHSSGAGTPCFGSGEGEEIISKLKTTNKLGDLFWYLWQWIKTLRDDGAYTKSYNFYDCRLRQGLPVWDGNTRIIANDKKRIATVEQFKLSGIKTTIKMEKPKL